MKISSSIKAGLNKGLKTFGYRLAPIDITSPAPFNYWQARRFQYFGRLLSLVKDIKGDIVECGIGVGETFFALSALACAENAGRDLWGFDSFEGFPEPTPEDASPRNPKKGEWNNFLSEDLIRQKLLNSGIPAGFIGQHVRLVKGFFNKSLPSFTGESVALLHLDVDLYQSYKDTLEFFWPKVPLGGVVLFDEYKQPGVTDVFPGAARAIDEFLADRKNLIQFDQTVNRYYIIKQ